MACQATGRTIHIVDFAIVTILYCLPVAAFDISRSIAGIAFIAARGLGNSDIGVASLIFAAILAGFFGRPGTTRAYFENIAVALQLVVGAGRRGIFASLVFAAILAGFLLAPSAVHAEFEFVAVAL